MTNSGRVVAALLLSVGVAGVAEAQSGQAQSRAQTEAEREQARFKAMDVNDDGIITRREWRGNARSFDRHDTNRDGRLSGTEIWIPGSRADARGERGSREDAQRREELLETFNRADRNNDGRLARNEWWSDSATFTRVDRNRDGWLSRAEYLGNDETFDPGATAGDEAQKETRAYRVAYERGLTEGRQAGKEDKEGPNRWDLDGQRELEQADSGYNADLGRREDYQAGYRAGFRLGYRQGFGPRR